VCDLETSRMGAPYIYDISRLRVNVCRLHIEPYLLWDVSGVTCMTDWKE